ncbi:MAG: hypothetical protein ABEJ22_05225 [Haloferacaceae archaeon]
MPSTRWHVAVWTLVALVVGYAVVVASRPLLGVFAAAMLYLLAWLAATATPEGGLGTHLSRPRAIVTAVLVVLVLAYSVLVAAQILLGVLVSLLVVAVSWVTNPVGPVAAYLRGSDGDGA